MRRAAWRATLVAAAGLAVLTGAAAAAQAAAPAKARPNPGVRRLHPPTERIEDVVLRRALPFRTVVRPDPALVLGAVRVVRPGVPGAEMVRLREVFAGGRLVGQVVLGAEVLRPAVPEIVLRGTAEAARDSLTPPAAATLTVLATAYWADPAWSNGITATGVPVHVGSVAVDPSVIPLGTRLYIPGYGYGIADDTGGAIRGDRIDVYFPSAAEALAWGLRTVRIEILGR